MTGTRRRPFKREPRRARLPDAGQLHQVDGRPLARRDRLLEIAASVLAIEHNVVPPTANLHSPDPECDLDYVPLMARERQTDAVLTVGSGFGGFQSAMVLRPGRR